MNNWCYFEEMVITVVEVVEMRLKMEKMSKIISELTEFSQHKHKHIYNGEPIALTATPSGLNGQYQPL